MTTPAKTPASAPTLRDRLDEYLAMRRALGFQLNDLERQVGGFCTWLEARGQTTTFTVDEAVSWARLNPDAHPSWWSTRLSLVRRFAAYLHANDVAVPVIPPGLLPARKPRAVPFIYSQDDLDALLAACDRVSRDKRIAATLRTAIGLLAATGLRIGEALKLNVGDIDHANDLLVVKAGKSAERLVPLHPTTTAALIDYLSLPARLAIRPDPEGPVFVTANGTRYVYADFQKLFTRVREDAGLLPRGQARPRLHDLRHTFATAPMTAAYAHGGDPDRALSLLATWLGHSDAAHTYWYLSATGELMALAAGLLELNAGTEPGEPLMNALATSLQTYFTTFAHSQRDLSSHTIGSYRDTWRMLLKHLTTTLGVSAEAIDFDALTATNISGFLDYLEHERGNSAKTRNLRLTAIRAVLSRALPDHPEHAATITQVLAIPPKRATRPVIEFLTPDEVAAVLAAPDQSTRTGRRDHALLAMTVQTGLRISEVCSLTIDDVQLGTGAHVTCTGKGRRQRITPLTTSTAAVMATYLTERSSRPGTALFCGPHGQSLSRDALEHRLATHVATAASTCPSLTAKHVTMHTLRHTAAMNLLAAGVDVAVIALWLGHADTHNTDAYLHADMAIKEKALDRTRPTDVKPGTYRPEPDILTWLTAL